MERRDTMILGILGNLGTLGIHNIIYIVPKLIRMKINLFISPYFCALFRINSLSLMYFKNLP